MSSKEVVMLRKSVIYSAMALVAILAPAATGTASADSSIDVVASNWKFTPSAIELHVGQTTTLRLRSVEGVHGLQSDDLGISQTVISSQGTTIQVTPKKTGTYVLHCAIFCGAGHAGMTLTVKVLP
jgi:cytochrome c oxidase subunit 2